MICFIFIKGNGWTFKGNNFFKIVLSLASYKESSDKWNNLLHVGANSFLLDQTPFQKGLEGSIENMNVSKITSFKKQMHQENSTEIPAQWLDRRITVVFKLLSTNQIALN